ncbi:ABC transporter permease [Parasporobacterium paucivorans]|uniref:Oligopeptide transport system permease protein n=1 Tax=Parasporobacterium paucivorans DSM 15970 TaxID=1122934 RepID=A0A1M6J8R2_9FIRM|nr:ABC transporter permease [Parasporobacterium paucivorans]SHJ43071.1 oligopeptide transport system permease protein [Parasporobacterium paucivorans DSM 15970]
MNSKFAFYVLKRLILALVTIFLVITITFFVMHAVPGGPFLSEKAPSAAVTAALESKFGLDKPVFEQYLTYLGDVAHFDFGPSIKQRGKDVSEVIMTGFSTSAKLGGAAALAAIVLGLIFGSIAAVFHNKPGDKIIMVISTAFVAMPSFIAATLLLLIFSIKLGVLPANGTQPGGMVLPVVALALYPLSYIIRLTRSSTLDVLGQDYIRTARAKGLKPVKILFKHSLRNAVTPVITYAGPMVAYIVTGSLVVEKILAVPGLGKEFIDSITSRDYTMIMGTTIFLAALVVVMMLISDILYKVFDPRVDLT